MDLFGVLLIMFYMFSAFGQHIFGGKMTYNYEEQINSSLYTTHYVQAHEIISETKL
ncbi:hypothetical protein IMG5_081160, partial [Ichthyophthirius multifiliis]